MAETRIKLDADPAWKKLYVLRDMTAMTGLLHEVQVKNLKMWPLVMLHAKEATCSFDYESKAVTFDIERIDKPRPKNFKARLQALTKATKMLLGADYAVLINLKGKEIHFDPAEAYLDHTHKPTEE